MEDAQIIELFFARSEDAISELDKKYGKLCHKLADNILASAQDAEECVNDAYLSTWNAIPPQRPESLPAFVGTLVLFMRRYWYADSFAEIGKLLGITEGNARLRLTRMRKQLKTYLTEQEVLV